MKKPWSRRLSKKKDIRYSLQRFMMYVIWIYQEIKMGPLQNSLKKSCIRIGPREEQNRSSRGPIFIACFEFSVRVALAFSFCNSPFLSDGTRSGGPYELRLPIFLQPLGGVLKNRSAAPASPPFICRWQRSAPLQSSPLPQKVRVLSAKAGENGMPFGKFAKERSNCL